MTKLFFGNSNSKLGKKTFTFDLPAGHFCPFALNCLSKADRVTGKITDGPQTTFRCYAASLEMRPIVRQRRWENYDLLKPLQDDRVAMAELIMDSLPPKAETIRIHSSGDFFNQKYFDAWLMVSRVYPDLVFYAYTKSIPYWMERAIQIPSNFKLTASFGGRKDEMIEQFDLKSAKVVLSEAEALMMDLEIDHNDMLAKGDKSFALLIHGSQPKGSEAGKAAFANLKAGHGYGKATIKSNKLKLQINNQ